MIAAFRNSGWRKRRRRRRRRIYKANFSLSVVNKMQLIITIKLGHCQQNYGCLTKGVWQKATNAEKEDWWVSLMMTSLTKGGVRSVIC